MFKFDPTQQESLQKFDLKESMWYSINVLLQGGTEYSPQTTSTRTVIAFYWFCILIINAAYTANLAAFLTIRQIDTAIRSVQDLVGRSDIQYGVMKDSVVEDFFQGARRDPYERMWSVMKMREDELIVDNMTLVVNRVLDGTFVFMADGIVNEFYASQHCGMESIEQDFGYKHFSIGLPKGAPYKDDVNRALLELKENGRLDILKTK